MTVVTEICTAEKRSTVPSLWGAFCSLSNLYHLCCSKNSYHIPVSESSVLACLTCIWEILCQEQLSSPRSFIVFFFYSFKENSVEMSMWERRTGQVNLTSEIRDFCGSEYEDYCILGCDTVWSDRKVPASQWNLLSLSWGHPQRWRQQAPLKCWYFYTRLRSVKCGKVLLPFLENYFSRKCVLDFTLVIRRSPEWREELFNHWSSEHQILPFSQWMVLVHICCRLQCCIARTWK
jgi:hypothetical protein